MRKTDDRDEDRQRSTMAEVSLRGMAGLGNVYRRMLAVFFGIAGPRATYAVTEVLAKLLYRLMDPLRIRSEAQCRAALGDRFSDVDIFHIARRSFVHRVWNLADLMLAERLLHAGTYERFEGGTAKPYVEKLRSAQLAGQPVILVTAYYGPFDLLPVFLGYLGIRAGVVYRPHANAGFDLYRRRIRARSGCELIPIERAADRVSALLARGRTVAIVADHHADRSGLPVTFLDLETRAMKSVGLLAWRYNALVAVAGLRRSGKPFQFEIEVADYWGSEAWNRHDDPVRYITERYPRGLEQIILADPAQYLWGHARWGEAFARQVANLHEPAFNAHGRLMN